MTAGYLCYVMFPHWWETALILTFGAMALWPSFKGKNER
jgi:hypothetical protein